MKAFAVTPYRLVLPASLSLEQFMAPAACEIPDDDPVGSGSSDPEQVQWVFPATLRSGELVPATWSVADLSVGSGYALRLRLVRRTLPQATFRQLWRRHLAEREQKSHPPLGRRALREAKEQFRSDTLRRVLPTLRDVDAVVATDGWVYVWTCGQATLERFEVAFRQRFCEPSGAALLPDRLSTYADCPPQPPTPGLKILTPFRAVVPSSLVAGPNAAFIHGKTIS